MSICGCVCVCVHPPLRLLITNAVMWHGMNPIWLVKQVYIVGIISRHCLTIEACLADQPNKSKLALCKPLLHLTSFKTAVYMKQDGVL